MKWAVTVRVLVLLLLPCVYIQAVACGGSTITAASNGSDSNGSNDNDNDSDDSSGSPVDTFNEESQFKSFSILMATLESFQTIEAQYLISSPTPSLLYATSADCGISGETIANSSLLDFNSCVVDVEDFRLLLSGEVEVSSPDSITDVFTYQLGVEVLDDDVDYVFGIEGTVTKTDTDSGDSFEFDIDTTLEDDAFGINGSLLLDDDRFTGNLSLLYNTLLASCSFDDFTISDFETFQSFCEF